MNTVEKITIITPTFNRAHTLSRVYNSLLKQSFKNFKWVIMDDGSTDNTTTVANSFIEENKIKIEYSKNENNKKFYTVFKAIKNVTTPYFAIIDSDDAYPENALEILVNEAEKLDSSKFISVIGHSVDEKGELFGDLFPQEFDGSVLEMRYKYKIKGDKNGLFITKPYQEYLKNFDFEKYKNKYAPQKIFFNIYDAAGLKTRFINEVVRIYFFDSTDMQSMSNDRVKPTSYEGLKDGYLSFINNYAYQLWAYPKAFLRNLIGYETYSILFKDNLFDTISVIKPFFIKILAIFLYPVSYVYAKKIINIRT